jgi:acyl carrier protein
MSDTAPLTLAKLESILLNAGLMNAAELNEQDTLADAGMDSLDLVEACMEIELEFGVGIDESQLGLTTGHTFRAFLNLVNNHIADNA